MGPALGSGLGVARGVVAVRRSGAASYSGPPQPRQTAGRQDLRRLSVRGAAACPECRGQDPRRRGHSWHQGGRLDTLQHPTSSGGDHMYAFISSLGSGGSSAAGAAPAAAGAADAAGADSVFCSLTMRDGLGPRTDLRPTRRRAGVKRGTGYIILGFGAGFPDHLSAPLVRRLFTARGAAAPRHRGTSRRQDPLRPDPIWRGWPWPAAPPGAK